MADVPTPDDVVEDINEGNPPTSLGDVAGRDAARDDEVVPDRRDDPSSES